MLFRSKASSQRPSSQACFPTKFIVLGLLGLSLLTSTVKGAPPIRTLQTIYNFWVSLYLLACFVLKNKLNKCIVVLKKKKSRLDWKLEQRVFFFFFGFRVGGV